MVLGVTAEANPCQSHQLTLACHTALCVRMCACVCVSVCSLHTQATEGFLPRLHAVPADWSVVF